LSVLQFGAEFCFDAKTLRKLSINVEKNFQKFGCSRSFTISDLKDKVNYIFLECAKFPKRGPYFLGDMARGVGKFPRKFGPGGPNFL
jgi:hypothetical protein